MDRTGTSETHRVRCPCGEIMYAAAESGVETCGGCGRTFRWQAQTAFKAQTAHAETIPKARSNWNGVIIPDSSTRFFSSQEPDIEVAYRKRSSVAKTSAPNASFPVLKSIYWVGFWVSFVLLFFGLWIYCLVGYGFIIGVLVGWLPSAIVAGIAAFVWPLVVILLVLLGHYL
jgi:hypothetical protein